ncbi:MAG TPA: endonuclease, partial [Candidatus Peribacter riflensis]|nr:endonuclease [Candidatus Peribacter riflensis]HBU09376.1 endonuclease [Candidatus Peribacter riflensis]
MYFAYVLHSLTADRQYVGISAHPERRLQEHNAGKVKSTRGYRPWQFLLKERYPDRLAARQREKYLKSAAGRRFRKQQLWGCSSAG